MHINCQTILAGRAIAICLVGLSFVWNFHQGFDIRRIDSGLILSPVADRLLIGESFGLELLKDIDEEMSPLLWMSTCDYNFSQSLALVRVVLVEAAFQGDDPAVAESRMFSAEEAARISLACSPSSSIPWTILAWLEHLRHDDTPLLRSYLDLSYRTGPYEGWSLIRRMEMQLRLYPKLSYVELTQLRQAVNWLIFKQQTPTLGELYVSATSEQRAFLREVLALAPEREQKRVAEIVRSNADDIELPLVEPLGSRPWK